MMTPFQLTIPTKIYFGRNIWKKALKIEESVFAGNIMVVTTGRSLNRLGYIEALKDSLKRNQRVKKVIVFDSISANPRLSEVQEAIQKGLIEEANIIIGFGGGSGMDAAKVVAAGIGMKRNAEEFFNQGIEPEKGTLPIIAIPTTAGTGSELSKAAIITDEQKKIKKGIRGTALYPTLAIVDSVFTESLPYQTTMETGFDVLAHGIESYLSKAASPYTRMQSEYAVEIVGRYLPLLAENLQDIEAREKMSFASMIMGINLGNASTCLPHRLQYPLGAYTKTSHGTGLAALFPAWIECEYQYNPRDIEKMMEILTGEYIQGKEACVKGIVRFINKIKLPISLSQLGVEWSLLDSLASEVSGNIQNDLAAQDGERDIIKKLYEKAWS